MSSLEVLIHKAIKRAEDCWGQMGDYFEFSEGSKRVEKALLYNDSKIPGFEDVGWYDFDKGLFICLMADLRNSSGRFCQALKGWMPPEKRVLYESFTMLAMFDFAVSKYSGKVTEFLGDGCLGLYYIPDNITPAERKKYFRDAWNTSTFVIGEGRDILNSCLNEIGIPELDIGVGLACSKGIVARVGNKNNSSAKVIGQCVYKASKLSGGVNEINMDKSFTTGWPGEKGGNLSFVENRRYRLKEKHKKYITPMELETKDSF